MFKLFSIFITIFYFFVFYKDLAPYLFNSEWTTDDALQQSYIFHEIWIKDLFKGDLITDVMKGYLAPIHYWVSYFFTYFTKSPILGGHFVMALQLGLALFFIFKISKKFTNSYALGLFAMTWLLHTRPFVQRLTCGLPRGWSPLILLATIYFTTSKKYKLSLIFLFIGCLTNPPATIIAAFFYGLVLLIESVQLKKITKHFKTLLILAPFYVLITYSVVKRDSKTVGQMVSYEQAMQMPQFQRVGAGSDKQGYNGRFPFAPHQSIKYDFNNYGFQPLKHRLYKKNNFISDNLGIILFIFVFLSLILNFKNKFKYCPKELYVYLFSILFVYFLSRPVAFKLYVPNRHLQIPMAIFWIIFISVFLFNYLKEKNYKLILPSFVLLSLFIYYMTGSGLQGSANFNYHIYKKGKVFKYIDMNLDKNILVAGHPTHIDPVLLFAKRKAYITTETAHPFYPVYFKEVDRRYRKSLKAHYARNFNEFNEALIGENIDYFIFNKNRFYPEVLKKEKKIAPWGDLVLKLTSYEPSTYFYKSIPKKVDLNKYPYLLYRDDHSVLVDIKKLREFYE